MDNQRIPLVKTEFGREATPALSTPVSANKENAWSWPDFLPSERHATGDQQLTNLNAPAVSSTSPNRTPEPAHSVKADESDFTSAGPEDPMLTESEEPLPALFDLDEIFQKDASPSLMEGPRPTNELLRRLIDQQKSPEILEAGVQKSLEVLDTLSTSLSRYAQVSPDADAWLGAISRLKKQAERKRTVVGVVGNTGAGKSSVINAMLDEERLVPTNCMRACTAVVTEMSWNDCVEENSRYRAEIEFISHAEWERELQILLTECVTENGAISRETADPNSDAGIAFAKCKAVYPKLTKDMLAESTVESLTKDQAALNCLGTTKTIRKSQPNAFYRELQRYVDSKEKATGKEKGEKKIAEMEHWPLIKVVKIYTKSPALSTGAVIVDLPGVHDSNAARAAVAQGYLKQCTGLWIVAPITRAVDDKAAKTLLGDSFKRQLKYDGGFSNVTFICSKTDDISITEATDSLGLEEQISGLDSQEKAFKRKIEDLQEKIADLSADKDRLKMDQDTADEDVEIWESLLDQLSSGDTVFAPANSKSKRKRSAPKEKDRKRRRTDDDESDEDFIVDDDESEASQSDTESEDDVQAPRQPLTEADIKAKLEELKSFRKDARRARVALEQQIKDVRVEIRGVKAKSAEVRAEMNAICIAGRNEYSKGAIQLDFAAGIKELDMENAIEEDEESFNPDIDMRDYDEVARSLPVFCVSSRAYQKLSGRLQKDENVAGFKTLEETEIPQLQTHCKKLTEAGRIQTCRSFLASMCQQLTTFVFWASDTGSGLDMTDEDKRKQVAYLELRLGELEKGLEKATEKCIKGVRTRHSDFLLQLALRRTC